MDVEILLLLDKQDNYNMIMHDYTCLLLLQ